MFESGIKMKIRLDQGEMKVELEALFLSFCEFPLSLDIQRKLVRAKRSEYGKNRENLISPLLISAPEFPRMDFHCYNRHEWCVK